MRVAFFTAGTNGAGHLARGIALGRALERAGFAGDYRMLGPRSPFAPGTRADWCSVEVREEQLASRETASGTELAKRIVAFQPDVLLVDMFWAPLRYILPIRDCEAWLLLRSFPPAWLVGPPEVPFDASQFARVVSIEPVSSGAITHAADPVVMINPEECQPRGALRRRLGVPQARRLVGVMHAGLPGEHRELTPATKRDETVVTFDLSGEAPLFPIAAWLGDCDELHCGAGYNSYWEARWLGYAQRTTFTPFRRHNDDQRWRLSKCAHHTMRENGADTIAGWIARG